MSDIQASEKIGNTSKNIPERIKKCQEKIAKDRKVIPDPIDDRKFQE